MRRDEEGFTVIELLATCLIIAAVMGLGAFAIRHFSQLRALEGATDEVVTELRGLQQDASSQSHPWVIGAYFKNNSNKWGTVRGNIKTGVCQVLSRRTVSAGISLSGASFADVTTQSLTGNCTTQVNESNTEIVFFFARGSATSGDVSLSHPNVSSGARTVTVSPITGRVTRS